MQAMLNNLIRLYTHTHIKLQGRGHEFGRELEDMRGERSWRGEGEIQEWCK